MSEYSTPGAESTSASGPRANFGERLVAALIDGVGLFVIQLVLGAIVGGTGRGLGVLVSLGYYTYFEGSPSGQTFGKKVMNIRVIDTSSGASIGYGRAAIRWLVRIVSALACLIGYFWMLWDKEKQTWHDKVAGCYVVPTSAYPVDKWPG
jgi:uncharacterized RDD family membrane protein YckC